MSIRKTMYLAIVLMALVPFLLFSAVILRVYNQRMEVLIEDSLQAVANAQITEMTNFCEQQMKSLTAMGGSEVFHAALRGELDAGTLDYVNDMLRAQTATNDYLGACALISRDEQVVACSEPTYEIQANTGFRTLTEHMRDGFRISNVVTSRDGAEERQAVIALTEIWEDGQVAGYLLTEISLDFYSSIRESSLLWNDATFYLLDGNGKIISAGTPDTEREYFVTTKEEREDYYAKYNAIDFETEPTGSFRYEISGRDYITYYSNIAYTDWQIQLSVNLDDYLGQQSLYALLGGFAALLCLALSGWIAYFTARRLIRPINAITGVLDQIRQTDDYSLRVGVVRKDELGTLSGEINRLIEFIETERLDVARKQRDLQRRAEQDALTKVMNRERIEHYLVEQMEICRRQGRTLAVLFSDLDEFKEVNSCYGHGVGDQVLQFFAAVLVRQTGGMVGRMGGDEFLTVVDLPEGGGALEEMLQRVERHLSGDFILRGGGQLPVFCCIGAVKVNYAANVPEGVTAQELIEQADALMYKVKNGGKRGYRILELGAPGEK